MRKTVLFTLMMSTLTSVSAQDYSMTIDGIKTELTFYSPEIVRVTKYQTEDPLGKSDPKVVVTMAPQNVTPELRKGTKTDTLLTSGVKVVCNKNTGMLSFFRPDGTTLIKERTKPTFTRRTAHTIDPYDVAQSFTLASGEAIYG